MKIYNTYNRKKEELKTIEEGLVKIYSCGPTVYSFAHIGNLRTYIFMDLFRRALQYDGYSLKHVMNITDVGHLVSDEDEGEDKMLKAAKKEQKSPYEIAKFYADIFFKDLDRLNITRPEVTPKATDHIDDMIEFVEGLIEKGYGYETSDGIYFDILKYDDYGKLSKLDFDNQRAGARVEVNDEKHHPSDFALWKKAPKNHIMQWKSPWGMGYPGWHIECSTMSRKYLGDTFDIHTGGVDHIPIHHENEIAQSQCLTNKPMANYWMHGEFLLVDNGKMSKSLGNTYTIDYLMDKGYRPLDYRYFCLNAIYRNKLNFTFEGLDAAKKSYTRMLEGVLVHKDGKDNVDEDLLKDELNSFKEAINDDLNIPLALASAWKLIRLENKSVKVYESLLQMDKILGLSFKDAKSILDEDLNQEIPSEVTKLVEKRQLARKDKNFTLADQYRDEIAALGYEVKDTREGPQVLKK